MCRLEANQWTTHNSLYSLRLDSHKLPFSLPILLHWSVKLLWHLSPLNYLELNECEAIKAVEHLMVKQNLEGVAADFLPGYKTENRQMLRRRLRLLNPAEATRVSREYSLGKLRVLLELKRDGRKKARLLLQGFREPLE